MWRIWWSLAVAGLRQRSTIVYVSDDGRCCCCAFSSSVSAGGWLTQGSSNKTLKENWAIKFATLSSAWMSPGGTLIRFSQDWFFLLHFFVRFELCTARHYGGGNILWQRHATLSRKYDNETSKVFPFSIFYDLIQLKRGTLSSPACNTDKKDFLESLWGAVLLHWFFQKL